MKLQYNIDMQTGKKNKNKGKYKLLKGGKVKPKYVNGTDDLLTGQTSINLEGDLTPNQWDNTIASQFNTSPQTSKTQSGVNSLAGNFGLWGQLYNLTGDTADSIRGDSRDATKNSISNILSPSSNLFRTIDDPSSTGVDYLNAIINPIGSGILQADKAKKEYNENKFKKDRASGALTKLYAQQNSQNQFKDGGVLLAKKLNTLNGGTLNPLSDDAVEVKASNPNQTDSVELGEAFVDHNEVIDRKNRVYSDSVFLPGGKSVAKEAKRLQKMKAEDYEYRFQAANSHIDKKLDDLFTFQETSKAKQKMAAGGVKMPYNGGGEIEMSKTEFMDEHKHLLKVLKSGSKADRMKEYNSQKKEVKKYKQDGGMLELTPELRKKLTYNIDKEVNKRVDAEVNKYIPMWDAGDTGVADYDKRMDSLDLVRKDYAKKITPAIRDYVQKNLGERREPIKPSYEFGDILQTGSTLAATYYPNLLVKRTIGQLEGPVSPQLEQGVRLKRMSADAPLAAAAQQTRQAQGIINKNTAQGSDLASATGSLLSKRLNAQNQIFGDLNTLNAQIANQEAGMNIGIRARNADKISNFKQSEVDFRNKKRQLKTENTANLSTKVLQQNRERNQMKLDQDRFNILSAQFGDSGVLSRLMADHPEIDWSKYYTPKKKFGGYLGKKLSKKK